MKKIKLFGVLSLALLTFTACGSEKNDDPTNTTEAKTASKTKKTTKEKKDTNLLINNSEFKKLADNTVDSEETKVVAQKDYSLDFTDDSWAEMKVKVDKVSILKVDDFEDFSGNKPEGFIILHLSLFDLTRDVTAYPQQGTILTSDGEQTDGSYSLDAWDGDLMKGAKKEGYAAYELKKLDNVESVKNIRFTFNANYDTDDFDDNNAFHDYDMTIDLK